MTPSINEEVITPFTSAAARQNGFPSRPPIANSRHASSRKTSKNSKRPTQKASTMTLATLLEIYLQSIQGRADHTRATRKSIVSRFRESWEHVFETEVRAITKTGVDRPERPGAPLR